MVQFGVVVQRQRVIAPAPAIADAREFVNDQRVDADASKRGRKRQTGLAAADDKHHGFAVSIRLDGLALLLPVGAAEVARKGLAGRTASADGFLEAFQLVQAGHHLQRFCGLARQQPHHPKAASDLRFELENGLDDIDPGPLHATRRGAPFRDGKSACPGVGLPGYHQCGNGFGALARRDRPRKRQQVAPVSVGGKKRRQRCLVRALERDIELPEPLRDQRLFRRDDALLEDRVLSSVHDVVLMQ